MGFCAGGGRSPILLFAHSIYFVPSILKGPSTSFIKAKVCGKGQKSARPVTRRVSLSLLTSLSAIVRSDVRSDVRFVFVVQLLANRPEAVEEVPTQRQPNQREEERQSSASRGDVRSRSGGERDEADCSEG